MSRASKYLRKKLAEGGQIPDLGAKLGKLKNPSKLDPNIPQNTGIAGGLLAQQRSEEDKAKQAESLQNKAAIFQKGMATFKAQNPEAVSTPIPQQKQILPKGDAQQLQQLQQRKTSNSNMAAQNTPEKIRERMGATKEQYEELMNVQQNADKVMKGTEYQNLLKANQEAQGKDPQVLARLEEINKGFKAEQDAITSKFSPPEAQRPDDGMPPWMTNKQKAALKQVNTENQATMESPEYQEALQKFEASKGQDSEAKALLEKLSGEMTAKQNAVAPQPRFTKESLMGSQGQQLQGAAPQRMAASAVSPATRPPKPNSADYPLGARDPGYSAAMAEHNTWTPPEDTSTPTTTTPVANDEGIKDTDSAPTIPSYDPDDFENAVDFKPTGTAMPSYQGPFGSPGEGAQSIRGFTDYFDMDGDGKVSIVERDHQRSIINGTQIDHEAPLQFKDTAGKPDRTQGQFKNLSDEEFEAAFDDWTVRNDEYQRKQEETYDFVRTWHNRGGAEEGNTNNQTDNPVDGGSSDNNNAGGDDDNTGGGNNNNSENDDMSNPEQAEGKVDTTEVDTTTKKDSSGAPIGIEQTGPTVTAPTVGVEKVIGDKPKVSDFSGPGGGKAFEMATEKYNAKLAETTSSDAQIEALDDAVAIERTEDDKVSPTEIVAAQMGEKPVEPKASDFMKPGGGGVDSIAYGTTLQQYEKNMATWSSGNAVSAPTESTAAEMTASTIGQELPTKPISTDFGADEEGRRKYQAARESYTVQIEELRGEERPRFKDFDGNREAYNQALRDFQEAPLPVTEEVKAAQGEVSEKATAAVDDAELTQKAEAAKRNTDAEEAALAEDEIVFDVNKDSYVSKVTGKVATVEQTTAAEAKEREAIVGEPATGEAAEIMSMYDYNQSQKRAIQGADAKKAAVKKLKAAGLSDETIAQRLADEPNLIADEMEDLPEDVRTTLSGLPKEALIDVQMESLMSGMEDGEVPAWARPALAKVEANLAKRGMTASSVGRDALFNAIIQSAIPMAQANASAIQGATAQDKQIAADFLAKNAGFEQQMNLANLSNDQQMRLANLSAKNQAASENLSNAQQTELANLNATLQTNLLQGKIAADMGVAQLNADQQRAVVNAQTNAGMDMAKFNAEQQVELTNSKFMQTMVSNKFNADQQAAMQNATAMASMDMANLDKNTKLAVTNAQAFLQMDMANLSNEQQATVLTAQQRQQALLSNQSAENAAKQFNAANQQQADQFMQNLGVQVEQYNATANSARDQFNTTEKNRIAALNAGNELQAQQFEAQLDTDIAKFNEQQDFQRDQWNASNAQAVEQSNVQWRRQANLADTAAQNAANQQNAQISYNLTSQELTQVWQQMRDEAAYIRQSFENEEQRKAQLLATAIGNEKLAEKFDKGSNQAAWLSEISNAIN